MSPSPLGETLRRARTAKGITIEDAERVTRIPRKYLEALELENFGILPAPVYARGFLRSYAGYLGLEPGELGRPDLRARRTAIHVARQRGDRASGSRTARRRGPALHTSTHGGGTRWGKNTAEASSGVEYETILNWIRGGSQ